MKIKLLKKMKSEFKDKNLWIKQIEELDINKMNKDYYDSINKIDYLEIVKNKEKDIINDEIIN